MGKIRDLFKKIRDTKGTFHAKMGSIKDRNSTDLTEAEDIKKRWQEHGLPLGSAGKESTCNAGNLGRSLGEGNGYSLQYSGLENSMDSIVHEVAESDTIERLN